MKQFGLQGPDIEPSGANDLLVQGLVLRDLEKEPLRSRMQVEDSMPINLKKDAVILWIFKGVSRLALLWQIYSRRCALGICLLQCGHR